MNKIIAVILVLTGIAIGAFLTQPLKAQTRSIEIRFFSNYCFATYGDSITYIRTGKNSVDCGIGKL